jgi:hypothetical protein
LIAEHLADSAKRTNVAIGAAERTQVDELVMMVLVVVLTLLRGRPNRDRQRGE